MKSKIYIKINGVKGDSAHPQHKGEIEADSMYFTVDAAIVESSEGKALPALYRLSVDKKAELASPRLMELAKTGKLLGKVVITVPSVDGYDAPAMIFTLENVRVAQFCLNAARRDEGGTYSEQVGFSCSKVTMEYKRKK